MLIDTIAQNGTQYLYKKFIQPSYSSPYLNIAFSLFEYSNKQPHAIMNLANFG